MKNFIKDHALYTILLHFALIMNTAMIQTAESTNEAEQEIAPNLKPAEQVKNKNNKFASIIKDLEGHLHDDYSAAHEDKFVAFLQKDLVDLYPIYKQAINSGVQESTENIQTGSQGGTDSVQEDRWVNSTGPFVNGGFANYTTTMLDRLKQDFIVEFVPLENILHDLRENLYNMPKDELEKIESLKTLTTLEARLKHYKTAFEAALPELKKKYQQNDTSPSAPQSTVPGSPIVTFQGSDAIVRYENAHKEFIKTITTMVNDKIASLLGTINSIKRMAKRRTNQD